MIMCMNTDMLRCYRKYFLILNASSDITSVVRHNGQSSWSKLPFSVLSWEDNCNADGIRMSSRQTAVKIL